VSLEDRFDEVRQLIIIGKEKGYLLYDEVNDLLPADLTSSPEDLDELMSVFGAAGIDLVDSDKGYRERDGAGPHPRRARQDERPGPDVPARDGHGAAAHP
jgi:RNA polymerase primary sigma factor